MTDRPQKNSLWDSLSALWLLFVPVITAIYTLLLPIAPNDLWYNVRAGAHIIATGKIPTTALFTTSVAPDAPYYYQAWLSQILLFKTLEIGGLSGLVLLRTFCFTAAFSVVIFTAWRRVNRTNSRQGTSRLGPLESVVLARTVAGAGLVGFLLAASNMDIRPQMFSTLFFALLLFIVFEWPFLDESKRRIIIALSAGLMALWANMHGAFLVGVLLLAALFIGEVFSFVALRRVGTADSALVQTGRLFFVSAIATLLNPRGTELYRYTFQLANNPINQRYIQEWQTPGFSQWYGTLFYISLVMVLLLYGGLLWKKRQEKAPLMILGIHQSELLGLALVTVMALRDVRSIIWFGLFLTPVLAVLVVNLLLQRQTKVLSPKVLLSGTVSQSTLVASRGFSAINKGLSLVLVFLPLIFLPQFRRKLPLPPEYFAHFAPTPIEKFPHGFRGDPPFLLSRDTPVEATEYLRKHPPQGRLWSNMVFGSYLIWAGFPEILPHADPRVELYPDSFWEEYALVQIGAPQAGEILKAGGFTTVLLHEEEDAGLLLRLQAEGWRVVLKNREAILLTVWE